MESEGRIDACSKRRKFEEYEIHCFSVPAPSLPGTHMVRLALARSVDVVPIPSLATIFLNRTFPLISPFSSESAPSPYELFIELHKGPESTTLLTKVWQNRNVIFRDPEHAHLFSSLPPLSFSEVMLATRLKTLPKPSTINRSLARSSPPVPRSRLSLSPSTRTYSSNSHSYSSHRSQYSSLRYALLPLFLGVGGTSSLLLDSTPPEDKPSLKTILKNVEQPDEGEFLVSAKAYRDARRKKSLIRRVFRVIKEYLLEPISTSLRFVHLAFLFLPVLITAPILALEFVDDSNVVKGRRREKRTRERTTTRWWYRLLVHQMEWAGPTFIKVSLNSFVVASFKLTELFIFSSLNGLDHVPTSSPRSFVSSSVNFTPKVSLTPSDIRRKSSKKPSDSPSTKSSPNSDKNLLEPVRSLKCTKPYLTQTSFLPITSRSNMSKNQESTQFVKFERRLLP